MEDIQKGSDLDSSHQSSKDERISNESSSQEKEEEKKSDSENQNYQNTLVSNPRQAFLHIPDNEKFNTFLAMSKKITTLKRKVNELNRRNIAIQRS